MEQLIDAILILYIFSPVFLLYILFWTKYNFRKKFKLQERIIEDIKQQNTDLKSLLIIQKNNKTY